jgi:glycosyltransferase involved in cell wall biosynthesis
MGRGCLVIYRDNAENLEVCGDAGLPYIDQASLTARMREAIAMSELERDRYRARAAQRVRERYNWDAVTTQYETLFGSLRRTA